MTVVSPQNLVGHIETPIYNRRIGPQTDHIDIVAQASFTTYGECHGSHRSFQDRIVLIDNNSSLFLSFATEQREAACLEAKGALAVVRIQKDISVPGMFFNLYHGGMDAQVNIHVLTALQPDLKEVIHALTHSENVTLHLTVDPNRWKTELWDSSTFLVTFRIFLPILDLVGIWVALKALYAHWGFHRVHKEGVASTIKLMRVGCAMELCCCTVRVTYCIIGPLLSSPVMSFGAQMFLPLVTVPFETTTKLISTYLFLRWGAFGPLSRRRHHVKAILLFFGAIVIILQLSLSTLQTTRASSLGMLLVVNTMCVFFILLITAILFLEYGRRFVKQLKSKLATATDDTRRARQLRRATYWIMFSGVAQVFIVASLLLAGVTDQAVRPQGFHATLFLIYFGASVGAIAQSEALTPFDENVSSLGTTLAKSVSRLVPSTSRAVSRLLRRNKVRSANATARAEFDRSNSIRLKEEDESPGELPMFDVSPQDLTSHVSQATVFEGDNMYAGSGEFEDCESPPRKDSCPSSDV